jgi:hypothetical protein
MPEELTETDTAKGNTAKGLGDRELDIVQKTGVRGGGFGTRIVPITLYLAAR